MTGHPYGPPVSLGKHFTLCSDDDTSHICYYSLLNCANDIYCLSPVVRIKFITTRIMSDLL